MNLDPRTIIIMNIIGTLLMSLSLFAISRGHLAQIQGVKRWSAATLVQSIGWLVVGALRGILPDFISIVVGNALLLLSIAFYFNIIAEFKNKLIPTFWAFSLVGFEAILLSYFLLVTPNAAARIVIISSCTSVLMLMGGYYLLFERGKRPISHTLTGSMFALCGVLLAVRCIYSLVWDTVPNQLPFGYHPLGSINYLTFFITSIMLTFGFVLMCNDKYINDRKQLEDALAKSEEKFRKLLEAAPDAMVIVDKEGKIKLVNIQTEKLFGYTKSELIGNEVEMLIPSRHKHIHKNHTKQFFDLHQTRSMGIGLDLLGIHKNGKEIPVEISLGLLEISEGIYVAASIRDISKRKKGEEALRLSELRYRSLTETSEDMIYIISPDGTVEYLNNSAAKQFGQPSADLIGKKMADLFPSNEADKRWQIFQKVFQNGQYDYGEDRTQLGGQFKWLGTNLVPLRDANGNITSVMGVSRDITLAKLAEKELIRLKENAENSGKIKEQFLANMSHEIRTPMNAIIGFTQLLEGTKLSDEQRGWLQTIKNSEENLLVIINDILDFSKMEAGKFEFEENKIDIADLIQSSVALLKPKADKKDIGLFFLIDKEIPPVVLGDSVRLTQILLNLVSNAIIYTNRGHVDVAVNLVKKTDKNIIVKFSVTDTGIGIENGKIKDIFESFTQASSSTTRKYGGTGLGLTIAKKLVEQQGGSLSVNSKFKEGSCFAFTLPFKKIGEYPMVIKAKGNESGIESVANINILVVEDNPVNQQLLKTVMSKWKINADIADNGKIAIDKLNSQNYDLILMDIHMPEMDGYKTTEYIRKTLLNKTPIIAMTAHAMKGEAKKCIQQGMNDYISKPFDPNDLLAKIIHHYKGIPGIHQQLKEVTKLNLSYLKEITEDDTSLLIEMLNVFIKNTPLQLLQFENALEAQDWLELKAIAHKLKSNLGVMGLEDCLPILKTIEDNAIQKINLDALPALVNKIALRCNEVIALLKIEIVKLSNS